MKTKRKEESEEFKWNPIWRERERKRRGDRAQRITGKGQD
jgi:hypothetical protein